MEKFNLSNRYTLELHWEKALYEQDGICKLYKAYFSGPVLLEAERIKDNDNIALDFYHQYLILVENVYVAKLFWGEVIYDKENKVWLRDAFIRHDLELNRVPKLKDNDYLVIDTSNHTTEKHPFNFVYKTFVVNEDTSLYNFRK